MFIVIRDTVQNVVWFVSL